MIIIKHNILRRCKYEDVSNVNRHDNYDEF